MSGTGTVWSYACLSTHYCPATWHMLLCARYAVPGTHVAYRPMRVSGMAQEREVRLVVGGHAVLPEGGARYATVLRIGYCYTRTMC
eukprot:2405190-Rhodomonas_salina.2